ncbi:MAG: metal-dependent transcriptional regulator [Thermodesulfovibrionales bacterium]|nr:metal-dependent transcriptional regulator [Thermodesulfovibrionales bacterium]
MKEKVDMDEYLEAIWYMKENNDMAKQKLIGYFGGDFNNEILDLLINENLITLTNDNKEISFTEKGESTAKRIIRAHRLAERLLFDAMGMSKDFEKGACEFEHTLTEELINSICTMLGHPKECPHGLPIPPGECCLNAVKTVESSVMYLTDMKIGQSGRIAYINSGNDEEMHKLNGLQLRPGAIIKLHQSYPAYVVECEGANIAIDEDIAKNITVWRLHGNKGDSRSKTTKMPTEKKSLWCRLIGK